MPFGPTPAPPPFATSTRAGLVSTVAQTIGGEKTFLDKILADSPVRLALYPTVSLPSAASNTGAVVYDTTVNLIKFSDGASWVSTSGSVGIGTAIGSGTAGSVLFVGAGTLLAQDNSNFFWDDTNNRLGVGTATPASAIDITGLYTTGWVARITNTDTTGNGGNLLIDAPDSGFGHPFITFRKNSLDVGGIQGNTGPTFGMIDGINLAAASGRNIGFRVGNTNVGSFDSSGNFIVDTNVLYVDATNNRVGIGTTGPSEALQVVGNLRFSGALMPNNLAGTAGQVLQSNGAGVAPTWITPGSGSISIGGSVVSGTTGSILFVGSGPVLSQDNTNLFWDDTNNRLGLGTATPSHTLDVTSAAADWVARIRSTDVSGSGGNLLLDNPSGSFGHPFITFRKNAVDRGGIQGYDTTAFGMRDGINLAAASGKNVNFRIGSTSVAHFDPSGNFTVDTNVLYVDATNNRVGVGTTTPSTAFHSTGLITAGAGMNSGGNIALTGEFDILPSADNTGDIGTDALRWRRVRAVTVVTGASLVFDNHIRPNVTDYVVEVRKADDVTVVASFDTVNGRVGIGTATPTQSLDIVGNIAVTGTVSAGEITLSSNILYIGTMKLTTGSAAPVSGTWTQGDRVYNSAPVAGGSGGWICTVSGTPGTWKEFELVSE